MEEAERITCHVFTVWRRSLWLHGAVCDCRCVKRPTWQCDVRCMITDEDRGDYRAVWWLGGDAFLQQASDSFPTFSMISSWNDTNELGSRHISGSSVAMGEGLIPLWRDLYNSELIMVTLRWGCIHVHLVRVRVRSSCFKTGSVFPQRSVCLWTQQFNSEAGQNKWVKVAKKMWSRLRSNPGAVHFWLWKSVQEAIFYWSVVKIV